MGFIKHYFKGYHEPGGMKGLLVMALPMMVSTSCDAVMTFTDRFFLAKLGTEYMNAAMGGFVTYQTLIFFFMGLVGYSTALVAQYYGADQKHQRAGNLGQPAECCVCPQNALRPHWSIDAITDKESID